MPFSAAVEAWRDLATQYAGDAPPDFLLDWIAKESGGNRCDPSGGYTDGNGVWQPEVGLFQLDTGNAAQAGVSLAALQANCSGGTDVGTADDQALAMSSGVDYVKALKLQTHQYLSAVGVDWDESTPDFWSLLRLQFAAGPGATKSWLTAATASLGRGPAGWDEFVSGADNSSNHWVQVAAENGGWAAGWAPSIFGDSKPLSPVEIGLIAVASIAAIVGAIYFDRWLHVGKEA